MAKPFVQADIAEPTTIPLPAGSRGTISTGDALTFDDYRIMRGAELLRGGFALDEVGAIRKNVAKIHRVPRAVGIRRDVASTGNLGQYARSGATAGGEW